MPTETTLKKQTIHFPDHVQSEVKMGVLVAILQLHGPLIHH